MTSYFTDSLKVSFNFDDEKLLQNPAELQGIVKYLYQKTEVQKARISEQEARITELELVNQALKCELAKFTSSHLQNNSTQKLDQGYPNLEANNIVVVVKEQIRFYLK